VTLTPAFSRERERGRAYSRGRRPRLQPLLPLAGEGGREAAGWG